jgi:hypothetical protein
MSNFSRLVLLLLFAFLCFVPASLSVAVSLPYSHLSHISQSFTSLQLSSSLSSPSTGLRAPYRPSSPHLTHPHPPFAGDPFPPRPTQHRGERLSRHSCPRQARPAVSHSAYTPRRRHRHSLSKIYITKVAERYVQTPAQSAPNSSSQLTTDTSAGKHSKQGSDSHAPLIPYPFAASSGQEPPRNRGRTFCPFHLPFPLPHHPSPAAVPYSPPLPTTHPPSPTRPSAGRHTAARGVRSARSPGGDRLKRARVFIREGRGKGRGQERMWGGALMVVVGGGRD